jgi:hypothetical protein
MTDVSGSEWGTPAPGYEAGIPGGPTFGGQGSAPGAQETLAFDVPDYAASGAAAGEVRTPQKSAEQLAYERGQRDMLRKVSTPRMTGWRVTCGICWAFWTLLFAISALVSLFHGGFGTFLAGGILAGLAGWYDYRIWTLRARRLTLFIIF